MANTCIPRGLPSAVSKLTVMVLAGLAFAAISIPKAGAVLVQPGQSGVPAVTSSFTPGTLAASIPVNTAFTTQVNISGTYGQSLYAVNAYSPSTPTLDIYTRFTITSGLVNQSSQVNFAISSVFSTDVSFLDAAQMNAAFAATGNPIFNTAGLNLVPPAQFSRSVDGNTIGFNYLPNELIPGDTTFVMLIRTNATTYTTGGSIGTVGNVVASGPVYQPAGPMVPIPEPSGALFGVLTLGAVLLSRKQREVAAVESE